MSGDKDRDEAMLDALFAEARAATPEAPADLMAAVLRDAERLQPAPRGLARNTGASAGNRGFFAEVLAGLGGWQAAAALAVFAVVGLAVGLVQPSGLETLTDGLTGGSGGETAVSFDIDDLITGGDA